MKRVHSCGVWLGMLASAGIIAPLPTLAVEHVVSQKNKAFSHKELKVQRGDVVSFPNEDPFFHNVFSLSPSKTFDLGSYPKGDTRKVTFDRPGKVDVECAIHPHMHLSITVE